MERTLAVTPTIEAMGYLTHVTRLSTDLNFDLLAVGGKEFVPIPVLTIVTSYQQVRQRLDQDSKNKVADAIRKVSPRAGAALKALSDFTGNNQQLMQMAKGGSLASELSSRPANAVIHAEDDACAVRGNAAIRSARFANATDGFQCAPFVHGSQQPGAKDGVG